MMNRCRSEFSSCARKLPNSRARAADGLCNPVQHRMLESSVATSRRKRGPCQVHGIEQELCFKRLAKMYGLTKSVLLVLEYKETGRHVPALKRGLHALGLIDRHDRIVLTV